MKKFLKDNIFKIIMLLIFTLLFILILPSVINEDKFITEDKYIDTIEIDDNDGRAIFTFINDTKKYIVYEANGVDLNIFDQLTSYNKVNVLIEDTDFNSTYRIIYSMSYQEEELFNVQDYYTSNNTFTIVLFFTFFISSIVLIFSFFFIKPKEIEYSSKKFVYKNNIKFLYIFIYFLIIPLIIIFVSLYLYIRNLINENELYITLCLFLFVILGIVGLVVVLREKFYYDNNKYYYTKPFGHTKCINRFDIKQVKFTIHSIALFKVVFIGKDDKKLYQFLDDGTVFKKDYFLNSLKENEIETVFIYK